MRCVYEASHEDPTRTIGDKINCLMIFDTRFPEVEEWRKDVVLFLTPRALFCRRSNH